MPEGNVRLEYSVGKDGHARNVKVLESSHELLEQPAIDSIVKSTFQSGIKEGRPMAARLRQTINFISPKNKSDSIARN